MTMTAKMKTNGSKQVTAKNAKTSTTKRATSIQKTITAKATKKTTSKKSMAKMKKEMKMIETKKTGTKLLNAADIHAVPAPFPEIPGYRMADIVSTVEWRDDNIGRRVNVRKYVESREETLQQYIHRLFPNSIASQYLKTTTRTNDMDVLSNLVDKFVKSTKANTPAEDVMVMHLRVGDVIDGTYVTVREFLEDRVDSYYALFGLKPKGWSPVYVRCLASFDRALKKTQELGFHKISLVYGFHINHHTILKSKRYIASLVVYAQSKGFEVELITDQDADVSFAYACNAKHFIPGGGGFSKLMAKVVRQKGNAVHYVRV
jgi:hypothetical protein